MRFSVGRAQERLAVALPANSLRGRFLSGAFWSVVGAGAWQGSVFASSVVVARMLGPGVFGEFGMIQSTVGMFGVFAGMGLGLTATRYIAEFRVRDPERAGRVTGFVLVSSLCLAGLIGVVVWLAAPSMCRGVMNAPQLAASLRIGALLLLFNVVTAVQSAALAGFEAFREIARTNTVRGAITLPVVSLGTWMWGLIGAISGLAVAACIGSVILHRALYRVAAKGGVRVTYNGLAAELPALWKLSIPALLSGAAIYPANWLVRVMVANQPGGYVELGLFTAAVRFQDAITYVGQTVGAALLPMLASVDKEQNSRLALGNHLLPWILGSVASLPLVSFPEAATWLLGPDFGTASACHALVIVLLSTTLLTYKQGLAREVVVHDMMWWGAASNFSRALITVVASALLRNSGAPGLAVAYLLANILVTVIFVPLYLRRGLASRDLLASKEGNVIWFTFAALAAVSLAGVGAVGRGVALLAALLLISAAAFRIGRRQLSRSAIHVM